MSRLVAAAYNELVGSVEDVLSQAGSVLSGTQADYIANGEPASIYGKLQQAAARQACRRYADNPSALPGRPGVLAENACRPYLDSIGYGQPPQIGTPFQGGQCATFYTLTYSYNLVGTGGTLIEPPVTRTARVLGPVSNFRGAGLPAFQQIRITIGTGADVALLSGSCPQGCYRNVEVVSLVREDGLPDNCGSPPPEVTPPVPPAAPGPPRERFNPSPDIDVEIGVEINPDGTISIDFGEGPEAIDPFRDPPQGGGGTPGGVGEPGVPSDTGEGGEASGDAPGGSVLTGLKLNFVDPPLGRTEYAPGVFRGVCYVYMGTSEGLDHDPAGAMVRDGQFVFAEKDGLTSWAVSANRGYNLRVTPYYRPAEVEEE